MDTTLSAMLTERFFSSESTSQQPRTEEGENTGNDAAEAVGCDQETRDRAECFALDLSGWRRKIRGWRSCLTFRRRHGK